MLQADRAASDDCCPDARERSAAAAEAILPSDGIEQQDSRWIAVILQTNIEDLDCETARSRVHR